MLASLSLSQLQNLISSQQLSIVELIGYYLSRIKEFDDYYNCFTEVFAADANVKAIEADKEIRDGRPLGVLHGIPIAIKDVIDISGKVTGCGSGAWRARHAKSTAGVVEALTNQGAIIIGKTHTVEFALGAWGTNRRLGTPRNPWDVVAHRAPGGSSSGSAVAVSAGLVPCALGTDTGGSIRVPAAWCGVSGLKTSINSIGMDGIVALSPTLDTVGPIARTVEDLALLFSVLSPRSLLGDVSTTSIENNAGAQGQLRIARLSENELNGIESDVRAMYERSIEVFQEHGAKIVLADLPVNFSTISELNSTILFTEGFDIFGEFATDYDLPLDEDVRLRLLQGQHIVRSEYDSALSLRIKHIRELTDIFTGFDALLTPTTGIVAPKINNIDQKSAPSMFTRMANFCGFCALAIPNGISSSGLPSSLQIIAPQGAEEGLLRIGSFYQTLTSWHKEFPPRFEA